MPEFSGAMATWTNQTNPDVPQSRILSNLGGEAGFCAFLRFCRFCTFSRPPFYLTRRRGFALVHPLREIRAQRNHLHQHLITDIIALVWRRYSLSPRTWRRLSSLVLMVPMVNLVMSLVMAVMAMIAIVVMGAPLSAQPRDSSLSP